MRFSVSGIKKPMERLLSVALAQYPSGRDCAGIVAQAKAAAAEIVVFPEMYSNGYARFDPDDPAARARWVAAAEAADGEFVENFGRAATSHRIHVVPTPSSSLRRCAGLGQLLSAHAR
jgi:deaminated glutathione amidase